MTRRTAWSWDDYRRQHGDASPAADAGGRAHSSRHRPPASDSVPAASPGAEKQEPRRPSTPPPRASFSPSPEGGGENGLTIRLGAVERSRLEEIAREGGLGAAEAALSILRAVLEDDAAAHGEAGT